MNWDQVKGNWKQLKGKAQQVWGDFTDDALDVIEGKREELVGRLQTKYGYTKKRPRRRQTAGSKSCDWVGLLGGTKVDSDLRGRRCGLRRPVGRSRTPQVTGLANNVDTFTVQLSGFANSSAELRRAEAVAGVEAVRNDIGLK
jgi:uncharacterized protein YjbJ (UPF0337 family)